MSFVRTVEARNLAEIRVLDESRPIRDGKILMDVLVEPIDLLEDHIRPS